MLKDELEVKGTTITPQMLRAYLYSEFLKVDNDELGNLVLQNTSKQIAVDALTILEGGVLSQDDETETTQVSASSQQKKTVATDLKHGQFAAAYRGNMHYFCRSSTFFQTYEVLTNFLQPQLLKHQQQYFRQRNQPATTTKSDTFQSFNFDGGVHVRVLDGNKACSDSTALFQQAARHMWAIYDNDTIISNNNS